MSISPPVMDVNEYHPNGIINIDLASVFYKSLDFWYNWYKLIFYQFYQLIKYYYK